MRFISAATAILLSSSHTANAQLVMTCGPEGVEGYTDASTNCYNNPKCPTGDQATECPPDKPVCYAVSSEQCLGAPETTSATTTTIPPTTTMAATTTPAQSLFGDDVVGSTNATTSSATTEQFVEVCALSYNDAIANCRTADQCINQDTALCSDVTHACFKVSEFLCPPAEPTTTTVAPGNLINGVPQIKVCGASSDDAARNYCTAPQCPTGDGCETGSACFTVPDLPCESTTTTSATAPATTTTTMMMTTTNTTVVAAAQTAPPTLAMTTASPVHNTYFCGETWQLAEANCLSAQPCPSGFGCTVQGEDCYQITTPKCISQAPTLSPTVTKGTVSPAPSTGLPGPTTSDPTKAPTVNTLFCGANYGEALENCSDATACPSGQNSECPDEMNCFVGIQCAKDSSDITDAPTPTVVTAAPTPAITQAGSSSSSTSPTTFWDKITGGGTNAPVSSVPVASTSSPTAATTAAATTASPTVSNTGEEPVPNPGNMYCGDDYNDAVMNCNDRVPCPDGFNGICPGTTSDPTVPQGCFPITKCEPSLPGVTTSPPIVSPSDSTNAPSTSGGGMDASSSPTNKPVTLKPTYNLGDFVGSSQSGDKSGGISLLGNGSIAKSLVLGCAVVLGAFAL